VARIDVEAMQPCRRESSEEGVWRQKAAPGCKEMPWIDSDAIAAVQASSQPPPRSAPQRLITETYCPCFLEREWAALQL